MSTPVTTAAPSPARSRRALSRLSQWGSAFMTRWGTWLRLGLLLLLAGLLGRAAMEVSWSEVGAALRRTPPLHAAAALLCSVLAYAAYAAYDSVGRRVAGVQTPWWQLAPLAAASFAFNQNLGYLVGGLALRYRLYRTLGLEPARVAALMGSSVVTQWLGHFTLLAVLLGGLGPKLGWPEPLPVTPGHARVAALGLGVLVLLYLALSAWSPWRKSRWRGHEFTLPRVPQALAQVALGALHWAAAGAIIWFALPPEAGFVEPLVVLLIASVVGVATHVPAGLGVIEVVFVGMLGPRLGTGPVIAALLVWRAAFQWLPLLAGGVWWWRAERRAKTGQAKPADA